jgi:hypothetical protein
MAYVDRIVRVYFAGNVKAIEFWSGIIDQPVLSLLGECSAHLFPDGDFSTANKD